MSDKEWRPKAGEEVMVRASVSRDGMADGRICVRMADGNHHWLAPRNLSPLPTPTPREPGDVLRDAADECIKHPNAIGGYYPTSVAMMLRVIADALEGTARPKPLPTLAEAVRAWLAEWDRTGMADNSPMREALARVEAEARQ